MTEPMTEDELAELAIEMVTRVRDEPAEDNARWLSLACPNPADWFRLTFVLAIAVPDDRTWNALTDWVGAEGRRRLRPHGTPAAAGRHRYRGEQLCDACKAWDRDRKRARRAVA